MIGAATVASSQTVEHQLVNPVRVRRHNDPMDLVQLAESVMKADQFVRATTGGKLMVIVEQIRALQDQVLVWHAQPLCKDLTRFFMGVPA